MHTDQKGFSLIELLLVLVVIAALGIAAFLLYPKVQVNRAVQAESTNLSSIQAGIKGLFLRGFYTNLSNSVAVNADLMPPSMVDGTDLKNQWEGTVTIAPSGPDGSAPTGNPRYYKITYTDVPKNVCTKLAMTSAANFGTVIVGATTVQDTFSAVQTPLVEATAVTACNASDVATMTFVGN